MMSASPAHPISVGGRGHQTQNRAIAVAGCLFMLQDG